MPDYTCQDDRGDGRSYSLKALHCRFGGSRCGMQHILNVPVVHAGHLQDDSRDRCQGDFQGVWCTQSDRRNSEHHEDDTAPGNKQYRDVHDRIYSCLIVHFPLQGFHHDIDCNRRSHCVYHVAYSHHEYDNINKKPHQHTLSKKQFEGK